MAGKSGKGSRKVGRGARSPARASYKKAGRVETNKKKALARHVKNHPNDKQCLYSIVVNYGKKLTAKEIIEKQWQCYLKGVI
tara:strand:+ start:30354 stop:30599 length:246 start_codon:yes stop_codon:yes gene_type:complete